MQGQVDFGLYLYIYLFIYDATLDELMLIEKQMQQTKKHKKLPATIEEKPQGCKQRDTCQNRWTRTHKSISVLTKIYKNVFSV